MLREYQGRVLAVDRQVARHCARLHVPDKRSLNASPIAATAFIYQRHDGRHPKHRRCHA